jgi:hypothetical protein
MEVWVAASSGAIARLISGVIRLLIAPWVQWAIEQRCSRLNYRQERIRTWREVISGVPGSFDHFAATSTYSEIRTHLAEDVRERLERPRTFIVPTKNL